MPATSAGMTAEMLCDWQAVQREHCPWVSLVLNPGKSFISNQSPAIAAL
jgi:hypothetical protein